MICFLCRQPLTPTADNPAWEFTEGYAHRSCALEHLDAATVHFNEKNEREP